MFLLCRLLHFVSEMSGPQCVHLLSVKIAAHPGILNLLLLCILISDVEAQVFVSQLPQDFWA